MRTRQRTCPVCSKEFTYEVKRGGDRRYCSHSCYRDAVRKKAQQKPPCSTEGCTLPSMYSSGLCNSCYYRLKRTGTLDRREHAYRWKQTNGYMAVSLKGHPLTGVNGLLYEHRMVLFDAIGMGPHPCHWCGDRVDWVKGKCRKGALVPDHLDGDKENNDLSNLVPACNKCNATRGLFMAWVRKHKDDRWLWEMYERVNVTYQQVGVVVATPHGG